MKRILSFAALALVSVMTLCAQTANEIISRMDAEFEKHRKEGLVMTMDIKIILIDQISTVIKTLGDKYCATVPAVGTVTWGDGKTTWTYDAEKNEITIDNASKSSEVESGAGDMFSGITDGYDTKLVSETDEAWYFKCKKSRSNKDKNDPKKMDLVVEKGTYKPLSMTAKATVATITIRDVSFGVTEEQVTYDPSAYPNAKIVDKR